MIYNIKHITILAYNFYFFIMSNNDGIDICMEDDVDISSDYQDLTSFLEEEMEMERYEKTVLLSPTISYPNTIVEKIPESLSNMPWIRMENDKLNEISQNIIWNLNTMIDFLQKEKISMHIHIQHYYMELCRQNIEINELKKLNNELKEQNIEMDELKKSNQELKEQTIEMEELKKLNNEYSMYICELKEQNILLENKNNDLQKRMDMIITMKGIAKIGDPKYKTKACREFNNGNHCIYGDICPFIHEIIECDNDQCNSNRCIYHHNSKCVSMTCVCKNVVCQDNKVLKESVVRHTRSTKSKIKTSNAIEHEKQLKTLFLRMIDVRLPTSIILGKP